MPTEKTAPKANRVIVSKRIFLLNSASSVAMLLLNLTVLLWATQYLLKRVDPEEYAILPVVMSLILLEPLIAVFLTAGLGRFTTEAYAKGDLKRITEITTTMMPVVGAAAVGVLGIGALVTWKIDVILNVPERLVPTAQRMFGLLIGSAAVQLALSPLAVGFQVLQRFVLRNALQLAASILRLALLLFFLIELGPRVEWVVVSQVSATVLVTVISCAISVRLLPPLRPARGALNWTSMKSVIAFNSWIFLAKVAQTIREGADPIILNKLASSIDVASFHVGSLPERYIRRFVLAALGPLGPVLTTLHATDRKEQLAAAYLRGGRLLTWGVALLVVPVIAYRYEMLNLYLGDVFEKYAGGVDVVLYLMLILIIRYPGIMLSKVANATANVKNYTCATLVVQSMNLFVTLMLVGGFELGARGSALGTLLTGAVAFPLVYWPMGNRMVGVTWGRFLSETLIPGLIPSVIAYAAHMSFRTLWPPETFVELAAVACAGVAVHLVAISLVSKRQDRDDFHRILLRVKSPQQLRKVETDN